MSAHRPYPSDIDPMLGTAIMIEANFWLMLVSGVVAPGSGPERLTDKRDFGPIMAEHTVATLVCTKCETTAATSALTPFLHQAMVTALDHLYGEHEDEFLSAVEARLADITPVQS